MMSRNEAVCFKCEFMGRLGELGQEGKGATAVHPMNEGGSMLRDVA